MPRGRAERRPPDQGHLHRLVMDLFATEDKRQLARAMDVLRRLTETISVEPAMSPQTFCCPLAGYFATTALDLGGGRFIRHNSRSGQRHCRQWWVPPLSWWMPSHSGHSDRHRSGLGRGLLAVPVPPDAGPSSMPIVRDSGAVAISRQRSGPTWVAVLPGDIEPLSVHRCHCRHRLRPAPPVRPRVSSCRRAVAAGLTVSPRVGVDNGRHASSQPSIVPRSWSGARCPRCAACRVAPEPPAARRKRDAAAGELLLRRRWGQSAPIRGDALWRRALVSVSPLPVPFEQLRSLTGRAGGALRMFQTLITLSTAPMANDALVDSACAASVVLARG